MSDFHKRFVEEIPGPDGRMINLVELAMEQLPDIHEYDVGMCGTKDIVLKPEHHGVEAYPPITVRFKDPQYPGDGRPRDLKSRYWELDGVYLVPFVTPAKKAEAAKPKGRRKKNTE